MISYMLYNEELCERNCWNVMCRIWKDKWFS